MSPLRCADLAVLFLARVFAGLLRCSYTTAARLYRDVTQPDRRLQPAFGLDRCAAGCGLFSVRRFGGLLGDLGPRIPFTSLRRSWRRRISSTACSCCPRGPAARDPPALYVACANPFRALLRLARFKALPGLALLYFFVEIGGVFPQSIWVLFTDIALVGAGTRSAFQLALVRFCSFARAGRFDA